MIAREPETFSPVVEHDGGNGPAAELHALEGNMRRRRELDQPVVERLHLQRPLHGRAGV